MLPGAAALDRLAAYTELYLGVLENERMCLCGMLAAEYQTLPDAMRSAVVDFFDANHTWLARLLERGRAEGTIRFSGSSQHAAQMIVGTLEGAMLVARPSRGSDQVPGGGRPAAQRVPRPRVILGPQGR